VAPAAISPNNVRSGPFTLASVDPPTGWVSAIPSIIVLTFSNPDHFSPTQYTLICSSPGTSAQAGIEVISTYAVTQSGSTETIDLSNLNLSDILAGDFCVLTFDLTTTEDPDGNVYSGPTGIAYSVINNGSPPKN
jgi:hypothetical protein